MPADPIPVEPHGTGLEGGHLPPVERLEVVDQPDDRGRQLLVAVEQTDAVAVLERHAGKRDAHREDRNAVEDVVQPLELEPAEKIDHQREPGGSHVRQHILDAADEGHGRVAPPQTGEIVGIDLAHELQIDSRLRQARCGRCQEPFQSDPLGRPVEASDDDGTARHALIDRARGDSMAAVAGRQEGDRRAVGIGDETAAVVGRIGRHEVRSRDQRPLQPDDLEEVQLLHDPADAPAFVGNAARRRDLVIVGQVDDLRRVHGARTVPPHRLQRPAGANAVEDDRIPWPRRERRGKHIGHRPGDAAHRDLGHAVKQAPPARQPLLAHEPPCKSALVGGDRRLLHARESNDAQRRSGRSHRPDEPLGVYELTVRCRFGIRKRDPKAVHHSPKTARCGQDAKTFPR
ncbi:MAG: hypothetical protein OJF58_000559 [Enhydrobacter sp.]|nr:MAG: hypothetical protein OJF58_000559 [Enhydrobacter sp.]